MFSFFYDITPKHLLGAIQFLKNIIFYGNKVLIVSKPHLDRIKSLFDEVELNLRNCKRVIICIQVGKFWFRLVKSFS